MGYVRLEEHSDWGKIYLSLPGRGLSAQRTADIKFGIKFKAGARIRVRWPDNSQSEERIVIKHFRSSVNDMGHTYPVKYSRPGVISDVRGVKHWTPLADLDVLEEDVPE